MVRPSTFAETTVVRGSFVRRRKPDTNDTQTKLRPVSHRFFPTRPAAMMENTTGPERPSSKANKGSRVPNRPGDWKMD